MTLTARIEQLTDKGTEQLRCHGAMAGDTDSAVTTRMIVSGVLWDLVNSLRADREDGRNGLAKDDEEE